MVIACTFLYYDSNNIQHSYSKKTTLHNLRNVLEKNIIDMLTNIDGLTNIAIDTDTNKLVQYSYYNIDNGLCSVLC